MKPKYQTFSDIPDNVSCFVSLQYLAMLKPNDAFKGRWVIAILIGNEGTFIRRARRPTGNMIRTIKRQFKKGTLHA